MRIYRKLAHPSPPRMQRGNRAKLHMDQEDKESQNFHKILGIIAECMKTMTREIVTINIMKEVKTTEKFK